MLSANIPAFSLHALRPPFQVIHSCEFVRDTHLSGIDPMTKYIFVSHHYVGYKDSRLFGPDNMPGDILRILASENVTSNSHNWSISKKVSFSIVNQ